MEVNVIADRRCRDGTPGDSAELATSGQVVASGQRVELADRRVEVATGDGA